MSLVIGRFDPPTTADLAYLDARRADAPDERLTVGVATDASDRFPPHVRVRWLRELLSHDSVVVLDEAATLPSDRPVQDGDRWLLPTAPGDAVRAEPMGRWDDLLAVVRPAFVRRVRMFGAESSGKSSMAAHLADVYQTVWVEERWRDLYVKHGHRWEPEHVLEVAMAQLEAEEQAALRANRLLFCDTDPLTTLIYARAAFGTAPAWLEAYCDSADYAARYAATLLFAPDLPWEPDPVREGPEARARYFPLFQAELELRRIPYTLVTGSGRAREQVGEQVAKAVLGEK